MARAATEVTGETAEARAAAKMEKTRENYYNSVGSMGLQITNKLKQKAQETTVQASTSENQAIMDVGEAAAPVKKKKKKRIMAVDEDAVLKEPE